MLNLTFRHIHLLFVLLFKISNDDPIKLSFDKHYMPLVETKRV